MLFTFKRERPAQQPPSDLSAPSHRQPRALPLRMSATSSSSSFALASSMEHRSSLPAGLTYAPWGRYGTPLHRGSPGPPEQPPQHRYRPRQAPPPSTSSPNMPGSSKLSARPVPHHLPTELRLPSRTYPPSHGATLCEPPRSPMSDGPGTGFTWGPPPTHRRPNIALEAMVCPHLPGAAASCLGRWGWGFVLSCDAAYTSFTMRDHIGLPSPLI